jgi:uncharacterized protein (TIGR02996 family)
MSDEQALLAAIRADPADDTPRLAYADWLDENAGHSTARPAGRPEGVTAAAPADANRARAEFIRVQCQLARLADEDDRYSELQARELRLFSRYGADWRDVPAHVEFRRGMLEVWGYANPKLFGGGGRDLFADHPVREVCLGTQDPDRWGEIAAQCPHLSRVETLRMTSGGEKIAFPDFLAMLSSEHLTGLTTLDASGGEYGDAGLFEILGSAGRRPVRGHWDRRRGTSSRAGAGLLPSLRNLRRLSLHRFRLTDRGVRLLLDSPLADTLTHLDLSHNGTDNEGPGMTAEGVGALVESRLWPRLEELNLGHLRLGNDPTAARLLFGALPRSNLRVLGLSGYAWSPDASGAALVGAMVSARSWGRLEALALSYNLFSPEDLQALFECPHLAGLRRLHLGGEVGGLDAAGLAGCPHLAGLTTLRLTCSRFDDDGMAALAASRHLRRLVHLNVDLCPVGDAGVAVFVRSPNAARLRLLEVPGVGDEALEAIATSGYLGRLTIVRFGGWAGPARFTPVTAAGALAIARSTTLPNLAVLDRAWPQAATAGLGALIGCERLAWVGWPMFQSVPDLTAAFRRFRGLPYPLTGLRPLFPWSMDTLI